MDNSITHVYKILHVPTGTVHSQYILYMYSSTVSTVTACSIMMYSKYMYKKEIRRNALTFHSQYLMDFNGMFTFQILYLTLWHFGPFLNFVYICNISASMSWCIGHAYMRFQKKMWQFKTANCQQLQVTLHEQPVKCCKHTVHQLVIQAPRINAVWCETLNPTVLVCSSRV